MNAPCAAIEVLKAIDKKKGFSEGIAISIEVLPSSLRSVSIASTPKLYSDPSQLIKLNGCRSCNFKNLGSPMKVKRASLISIKISPILSYYRDLTSETQLTLPKHHKLTQVIRSNGETILKQVSRLERLRALSAGNR